MKNIDQKRQIVRLYAEYFRYKYKLPPIGIVGDYYFNSVIPTADSLENIFGEFTSDLEIQNKTMIYSIVNKIMSDTPDLNMDCHDCIHHILDIPPTDSGESLLRVRLRLNGLGNDLYSIENIITKIEYSYLYKNKIPWPISDHKFSREQFNIRTMMMVAEILRRDIQS